MKIVLRAFQGKLSGIMEVPEETGIRFRLALAQPVQFKQGFARKDENSPMMDKPIQTMCEFEYTGAIFSQAGHEWDGAREYQLVSIDKR